MRLRFDTLSLRLGALFVVILLAAALVLAVLFDRERLASLRERELENVRVHALHIADEFKDRIDRLRDDIRFLSFVSPLSEVLPVCAPQGGQGTVQDHWREDLQRVLATFGEARHEYRGLLLLGPDGAELARAGTPVSARGIQQLWRNAARLPEGEVFVMRVDGGTAAAASELLRGGAPVRADNGDLLGVVVADLDMRMLIEHVAGPVHAGQRVYLADERGMLLLSPATDGVPPERVYDVFPAHADAITVLAPGVGAFLSRGERPGADAVFATMVPFALSGSDAGFLVLIAVSAHELTGGTADPFRRNLLPAGLLVAMALLLGILLIRRLTDSLRGLAEAAGAIAEGDYAVALPMASGAEEGALLRAFRRMADEVHSREQALADLNRELERRVEERTRALAHSRAEVARQQTLQRQVLESVGEGVVVADRDGRFLLWNRKAVELHGRGPEDVPPERWAEVYGLWHSEEGGPIPLDQVPLVRAIRGESFDDAEVLIHGSGRWLSVRGRPLRDADGLLAGGVLTVVDGTARRHWHERLEVHVGELAEVGRLSLMAEVGAIASHELSQPVAAMANYAGAALQLHRAGRLGDERLEEILTHITRLASRAGHALESLRVLTRRRTPAPTDVDVNAVVSSCIDLIGDRCRRRGVEVQAALAPGLRPVRGDAIELEQLLMHLVINALESLDQVQREGRRLSFATRALFQPERIQIEVRDNGRGVPPKLAATVFEPWVTDKPEGLGIGLSIARSLAEAYGGRVWHEPTEPPGALFILELLQRGRGR